MIPWKYRKMLRQVARALAGGALVGAAYWAAYPLEFWRRAVIVCSVNAALIFFRRD